MLDSRASGSMTSEWPNPLAVEGKRDVMSQKHGHVSFLENPDRTHLKGCSQNDPEVTEVRSVSG